MRPTPVASLLLLGLISSTLAQEAPKPPEQKAKLIDLNVQDTPLPDVVEWLAGRTNVNFVLLSSPGADLSRIKVTVKLQQVTIEQIMAVLTQLPEYGIAMNAVPGENGAKDVVTLTVANPPMNDGRKVEITATVQLRSRATKEEITSLITGSLEAARLAEPAPTLFYHPPTGILIVTGTVDQTQLLVRLGAMLEEDRKKAEPAEVSAMRAQLEQAQLQLAQMSVQMEERVRQINGSREENAALRARLQSLQDSAPKTPAPQPK